MVAVTRDLLCDAREGETALQGWRHTLMTAVLARIAASGAPFVLRGGLLTRAWIAPLPRPTRDLDLVGDFAFDVADATARFRAALTPNVDDGVSIELREARGIWLDSAFPGLHVELAVGKGGVTETIGVDIGFRDPLVPPTVTWPCGLRAVRPETQLAWKLHALVEHGESWRPKDIADLWLLTTRVALVDAELPAAIDVAFTSRGYAVTDARTVFELPRWQTKTARVRWATTRGLELSTALAAVHARLSPILEALR